MVWLVGWVLSLCGFLLLGFAFGVDFGGCLLLDGSCLVILGCHDGFPGLRIF